ncbi:MAG: NAD(P)/FAD-dependent oxidoreductase [Deltaproteobacteria bacterium]|nr:NAD(P)/FAD-dependent oxidoreductase [Deltaproteobacteria bacterium]
MKLILSNLRADRELDRDGLKELAASAIGTTPERIQDCSVLKVSRDARHRPVIWVYRLLAETDLANVPTVPGRIEPVTVEIPYQPPTPLPSRPASRPVVIGAGPAGLFAALVLAEGGAPPLILEMGEPVEKRTVTVARFWRYGTLNPRSNVQFGEGGAGAFSDGKLTTRKNDRRIGWVFRRLVEYGAPERILTDGKPHIGTNFLKRLLRRLRDHLEQLGTEFRFGTEVTDILHLNGRVAGLRISTGEEISASRVVLAPGHSARDLFPALERAGLRMEAKPFAVGFRVEHPQPLIDRARYGKERDGPLPAADYRLAVTDRETGRGVYSFCMCPGGLVINASSAPGGLVVNGMSNFARDHRFANAALVVQINPDDFPGQGPLRGMDWQAELEKRAFALGGGSYRAPAQRLVDYLAQRESASLPSTSFLPSVVAADLHGLLPQPCEAALERSIRRFTRQIRGFDSEEALLIAVESRTSSPVQIARTQTLEAEGLMGLYPAGEGPGWAGGIVSAAVDGMKVAESLLSTLR